AKRDIRRGAVCTLAGRLKSVPMGGRPECARWLCCTMVAETSGIHEGRDLVSPSGALRLAELALEDTRSRHARPLSIERPPSRSDAQSTERYPADQSRRA